MLEHLRERGFRPGEDPNPVHVLDVQARRYPLQFDTRVERRGACPVDDAHADLPVHELKDRANARQIVSLQVAVWIVAVLTDDGAGGGVLTSMIRTWSGSSCSIRPAGGRDASDEWDGGETVLVDMTYDAVIWKAFGA